MPQYDNVNSPSHYQHGGIETIEVIQTMLTPEEFIGYCNCCALLREPCSGCECDEGILEYLNKEER